MCALPYRSLSRPLVFANLRYPTQNCHGQPRGMRPHSVRLLGSRLFSNGECTSLWRVSASTVDNNGGWPSVPFPKIVVETNDEPSALDRIWLIFEQSGIFLGFIILFFCPSALADAGAGVVSYNPEQSSETLKNIAGAGYILLVIFYFVRLFKKRAARAVEVKLSSKESTGVEKMKDALDKLDDDDIKDEEVDEADVTPLQCFIGVAQAGTICYLLYLVSTAVDDYFARQSVPDQYTARNITLLIQSVVRGLVYLAVGIFGANATGLAALGIQLVVNPDGVDKTFSVGKATSTQEKLPSVKVTDNISDIKRAFKEAENMGKRENSK